VSGGITIGIVLEPLRLMGEALSDKVLPLIMELRGCKVFVDGFEKFLELITEVLELSVTTGECEVFQHCMKNLLVSAGMWEDKLVECEPDMGAIIEETDVWFDFLVDAIMEGFSTSLENKDGKEMAMINNIAIGVGMDFGFTLFPFLFGNVGDTFELLGTKVLQVNDVEKIPRPDHVCEVVVFAQGVDHGAMRPSIPV